MCCIMVRSRDVLSGVYAGVFFFCGAGVFVLTRLLMCGWVWLQITEPGLRRCFLVLFTKVPLWYLLLSHCRVLS